MVDFHKLLHRGSPHAGPTPNAEQKAYIDAVRGGKHTCLTGPAGTGKSFTIDRLKELYPYSLSITASTGIAAVNVGGMTIHSWAGLRMGTDTARYLAKCITDRKGRAYDKIISARRLVIDEISMMSADLFDKMDEVLRLVRKCDEPFGGIQLLAVGDFLQLPPVIREKDDDDQTHFWDKPSGRRFAFESRAWKEGGIQVHELKTIVRQADAKFAVVMNKIRRGVLDDEVLAMLQSRVSADDPDPHIRPVKANGYNREVEAINQRELQKLKSPVRTFKAEDSGNPAFVEQIRKHCIAPELLSVKQGAQVMLLRNLDTEGGLVNGSVGIVQDFAPDGLPLVEFNGQVEKVEPATWKIERDGEVLASRTQIPLKLAWAMTIHKSQGQTIDKLEVDLRSAFEAGQAYVALSRCRKLEGLFLTGLDPSRIFADETALKFYGYL